MTYALAALKAVADSMQEPILMIGVLKFHAYEVDATSVTQVSSGKIGADSAAARFAAATEQSGFKIESDKPYAEVR
jgi:hypothetical protein